jgi:hypothetical protein
MIAGLLTILFLFGFSLFCFYQLRMADDVGEGYEVDGVELLKFTFWCLSGVFSFIVGSVLLLGFLLTLAV